MKALNLRKRSRNKAGGLECLVPDNDKSPWAVTFSQASCYADQVASNQERLFHQLCQFGRDGVGPDLVTLGGEMQKVRHDFLGQGAVGLEELVADIQEINIFAIVELRNDGIDLNAQRL